MTAVDQIPQPTPVPGQDPETIINMEEQETHVISEDDTELGRPDDENNVGGRNPPEPMSASPPLGNRKTDWLAKGCEHITNRQGSLEVPFSGACKSVLQSLQEAEGVKGGPRKVLNQLKEVMRTANLQRIGEQFLSDADDEDENESVITTYDDEEYSHSILKCIRRVMVAEKKVSASSKTEGRAAGKRARTKSRKSSTVQGFIPREMPPGGVLNAQGTINGNLPSLSELGGINGYSNQVYWKYVSYLELV